MCYCQYSRLNSVSRLKLTDDISTKPCKKMIQESAISCADGIDMNHAILYFPDHRTGAKEKVREVLAGHPMDATAQL
jgi:hypothetical protein